MWPEGNHLHAYASQIVLFQENVSLMMVLNLVSDVIMYKPNQTPPTLLEYTPFTLQEYTQRHELLCYFIPRSIHARVAAYRGISARQYRRELRRRFRN